MSNGRKYRLVLGGLIGIPLVTGCLLLMDSGEVSSGCSEGSKLCDGTCVSVSNPEFGCGAEECRPCTLANAKSVCDNNGECAVGACFGRYNDCDGVASTGCEVNLDLNAEHCGSCSAEPCEVDGAEPACAQGNCAIKRCLPGRSDCNRASDDGCETDLSSDADHCGECGNACGDDMRCFDGGCAIPAAGDE